ncbi:MAG: cupin domain-containing protein [Hyphomonadaceae bacterium]|nr:cupin domain-containing protein [Hyphomonadaceae bacterium]
MSLRHHPSDDILTAYASGALEAGFGLVVGAHLEVCATCRARVGTFEAVSGAALKSLPDAEIGADALSNVLARLETQAGASDRQDTRPLLERLSLKPKKWIAPGVWVAAVNTPHAKDNRVYLLSVAPGMPAARHEHSGAEFCTVLKGAFRDEVGLFQAGDFAAADDNLCHLPVVEGDEPCLCLFATEGRLKAQGLLGRLAFAYADV